MKGASAGGLDSVVQVLMSLTSLDDSSTWSSRTDSRTRAELVRFRQGRGTP